ncbi:lipid phosphate phosphatase 2-like isoform X2 [Punica granatum]|uniref:Lipid phosphate phosphatase 2-like isoform X2 n=2 Tax=Punica granatum TaxID=22663 RepID=A0A6P8DFX0_PUNGR|nr:lipid phosphate phosphatase 2-like isoform X2 [Punica granatum]
MSNRDWESLALLRNLSGFFLQDVSIPRLGYSSLTRDQSDSSAKTPLVEYTNSELKMRQNQCNNGPHLIRSHGAKVAQTYLYDWLILMLLGLALVVIHLIHPFYRYVGKDMMTDLKYPLKDNTVPFWAVPMIAVGLPIGVFIIVYLRKRDVCDLHHAVLGLLYSALVTSVITNTVKNAVGRPRPDFFWRCFPDGKDVYDQFGNVICHGENKVVDEGHRSFPSGHTSWSFAGLGFLSLYLAGKIEAFDRRGHVAKLCIVFLPLLVASLIGISRVDDYWHHWQDVFAGGLLGLAVATFCYMQFFPPPYHPEGRIPHTCSQDSEGLRTNARDSPNNEERTRNGVESQENEGTGNGCIGLSTSRTSSQTLEEMESGGR